MNRYYPADCFSINEDRTRRNRAAYDRAQEDLDRKCSEINPRYHSLSLSAQQAIRGFIRGESPEASGALRWAMKRNGLDTLTRDALAKL